MEALTERVMAGEVLIALLDMVAGCVVADYERSPIFGSHSCFFLRGDSLQIKSTGHKPSLCMLGLTQKMAWKSQGRRQRLAAAKLERVSNKTPPAMSSNITGALMKDGRHKTG